MDIHTLKECISKADDPRRTSHGHVLHRFEDIIIIGLCTVISGGEDFADMEMFGRERKDWLRRFLDQAKYGRVSKQKMRYKAALNPEALLDILFLRKK